MTLLARRWFRFGLRTLFVALTIPGVWLGWELHVVRERKAMRAWLDEHHCQVMGVPRKGVMLVPSGQLSQFPKYRTYFGEDRVYWIILREQLPAAVIENIQTIFPEALVMPFVPADGDSGPGADR